MKNTLQNKCIFLVVVALLCSCESFVEVAPPKTETASSTVYTDDLAATSAIRGIYHEMERTGFANGAVGSVSFFAGASADELRSHTTTLDEFFSNSISVANSTVQSDLWSTCYKIIYYSNSAVEGLQTSSSLTVSVKNQLEGEAKFLRAFTYFYLVNFFGDVPLILSTDYKTNQYAAKSPASNVYASIVTDLLDAQNLLPVDFQFSGGERVRATQWAATALLARVYLYSKDWANAEAQASKVIASKPLFSLATDPNTVFLKNSTETIWQLMPVIPGGNANEGLYFIPATLNSAPTYVSLTDGMVNAFAAGDKRKTSWVSNSTVGVNKFYFPFKYKVGKTGQPITEYSMILRLAEQYLIRAEARAQQGLFSLAIQDLDVIRQRAGLASLNVAIPSPSLDAVLNAVAQERRVELFTEWGHRWLDLKRTGKANAVLGSKPNWRTTAVLYPIPQSELVSDPNLAPQNPGY